MPRTAAVSGVCAKAAVKAKGERRRTQQAFFEKTIASASPILRSGATQELQNLPRRVFFLISSGPRTTILATMISLNARYLLLKWLPAFAVLGLTSQFTIAQSPSPQLWSGLQWRLIGPFRAGRVVAVAGAPASDGTFYFGGVDGGVWKTTDAGTVWKPLFDHEPVSSIGALAVAPSNPQVIYAGTGESDIRSDLSSGDGVYRSGDGGNSWAHVGLSDTRQISQILIDPKNADTVYVGALGHAYGPNDERGVYKSTDGGAHWQHVLDNGPTIGIAALAIAVAKPRILFATTWDAHRPSWSTYAPLEGPGNALYRTTDGGAHWEPIAGHGLPKGPWGRTGVAVSADGKRVYATVTVDPGSGGEMGTSKSGTGLYRSDDGGDTWALINSDSRLTSRGWYFNSITIDTENPDVLYIPNVALYRTEDGGKTIEIVRGAPGGDDYHQVWVDPKNSNHLMLGVDQGATASLDYGKTWTTWYNQPTAQLYHVTTDHRFPYAVYGAQQDSGSIAVYSRSDHGHIDTRDWFLPGGSESGYIAIDPKDENIIYLSGTYGEIDRFDRTTSFSQNISPWPLGGFDAAINKRRYRDPWTPVLVFSPADKTSLYLGTQYVMKTSDGGLHWQKISPDLTGFEAGASDTGPATEANAEQRGYGVVYTIAPSPLRSELIWAGSDTGRIHVTRDGGKHWEDVTPPKLTPWSKMSLIEASHFDPGTAYAAVDRHRLDDMRPYLYVTHDYGKSWKLSIDGIPADHFLRAVREDPEQRGLLYAGTELGVYVSFDDGDHWQPLQQNLPAASVRDLDVHGDDLVIATHGRSFWIMDDITPLRQAAAAKDAKGFLYKPETAMRVDNDPFLGTPLPPEEPQAKNPPDGAILDYFVPSAGAKTVTLQLLDAHGTVLRHFSSAEKTAIKRPLLPIAERWFPKPQQLDTLPGEHRFEWDLSAGGGGASLADADEDNPGMPPGPRVLPGLYTVKLTVDGVTSEKPLRVTMDPRSSATPAVLDGQYELAMSIFNAAVKARKSMAELQSVSTALDKLLSIQSAMNIKNRGTIQDAQSKLKKIQGTDDDDADAQKAGLSQATAGLGVALEIVESGDRQAPEQALTIYHQMAAASTADTVRWEQYKQTELPELNRTLKQSGLAPIEISAIVEEVHYAMTR
jgi:photosystem II stability/assembly factor-like uncharacterized protein